MKRIGTNNRTGEIFVSMTKSEFELISGDYIKDNEEFSFSEYQRNVLEKFRINRDLPDIINFLINELCNLKELLGKGRLEEQVHRHDEE